MSGKGENLQGKAKALRDALARLSLSSRTDAFKFRDLLDGIRRLALVPECPKEVVKEVERLLMESAFLENERDRKIFAEAVTPLVRRFDRSGLAASLTKAIAAKTPPALEMLQAVRWSRIRFSSYHLASIYKEAESNPRLMGEAILLLLSHPLFDLIGVAAHLQDRDLLGQALRIAKLRSESPFDALEHSTWSALLQAALDIRDYQLFMRAFEHLHSRFDYLRLRDWGPLSKQIRNAIFLLPKDEATQVRKVFYYDEVDTDKCLRTLQTAPLPSRLDGRGDWPFVGAGRILMRWLINGYISHSADVLKSRVTVVVDGVLALPRERQSDAVYQLLARGQGVYAGALAEWPLQGIKDICLRLHSLGDAELRAIFEMPRVIRDEICTLILPPDFPEPPPLPIELGSMADIANLTLANQRDFLNGDISVDGTWFTRLSPLVDRLCSKRSSREAWITAFLWLIETLTRGVGGLISVNSYAHEFKNEFDREWLDSMIEASSDAEQANVLRVKFIDRVEHFLVSRTWIYAGQRRRIRVDREFDRLILTWQKRWKDDPIGDSRVNYPRPLVLWMMEGERESTLLPLVREVLGNAFKALEPLPPQSRLFRFEVTIEDEYWAKLSVRNSHDPWSERTSATGRGQLIIDGFCKRLRSRANQVRTPRYRESVIEPEFVTTGDLKVFEQEVYLPLAEAGIAKEL